MFFKLGRVFMIALIAISDAWFTGYPKMPVDIEGNAIDFNPFLSAKFKQLI